MKIRCFLLTCWHTLKHWLYGGDAIVEGHIYKTEEVLLDRVVFIDKCVDCGKKSITHSDRNIYELMKAEGKK